jgi:hypothetical protein
MKPFQAGDVLRDPARTARAVERLEKFASARIRLPGRDVALQLLPGTGNAVFDLRDITATGLSDPVIFPTAPADGYVLFADSSEPSGYVWVNLGTELTTWISRVDALGGTYTVRSKAIAARVLRALRAESYSSKVRYLMALLGDNLAAARVPLRDTSGVGAATSVNMVDADFSEASGLTGNGTNKALTLPLRPSDIGTGNNGGLGFWVGATGAPSGYQIGIFSSDTGGQVFALQLHSAGETFWWGDGNSPATRGTAASAGHYYGQRSSASARALYRNGTSIATDAGTVNDGGSNDQLIQLFNRTGDTAYSAYRCACAYLTDGTMTAPEIASFHALLQDTLITPLGR